MTTGGQEHKRRWRDYQTKSGSRPVKEFVGTLSDADAASIAAAMKDVAQEGLVIARHLRGDIYDLRAAGEHQSFRILFATEGHYSQICSHAKDSRRRHRRLRPQRSSSPSDGLLIGATVPTDYRGGERFSTDMLSRLIVYRLCDMLDDIEMRAAYGRA